MSGKLDIAISFDGQNFKHLSTREEITAFTVMLRQYLALTEEPLQTKELNADLPLCANDKCKKPFLPSHGSQKYCCHKCTAQQNSRIGQKRIQERLRQDKPESVAVILKNQGLRIKDGEIVPIKKVTW